MSKEREYTTLEEKINSGTHFITLLIYLVVCPILIIRASVSGVDVSIAGLVLYSIGLIAVFFTSTMYHFIEGKELKKKSGVGSVF